MSVCLFVCNAVTSESLWPGQVIFGTQAHLRMVRSSSNVKVIDQGQSRSQGQKSVSCVAYPVCLWSVFDWKAVLWNFENNSVKSGDNLQSTPNHIIFGQNKKISLKRLNPSASIFTTDGRHWPVNCVVNIQSHMMIIFSLQYRPRPAQVCPRLVEWRYSSLNFKIGC